MRRALFQSCLFLASALLLAAMPADAQAPGVAAILANLRQHGYESPAAVIQSLQAAPDRPGPQAPVAVRRLYAGTLGSLAAPAADEALYARMRDDLERMAAREACRPCQAQALLLRAQWELTRSGATASLRMIAKAEPLLGSAPPPDLLAQFYSRRSRSYRLGGDFAHSIKDAVAAYRLATATDNPALQVEMDISLALDNAELGDFARADRQIDEAVALARRIGFGYQLAYAHLNLGHIRSLENRRDEQREALLAAYALSHGKPDLSEVEMISLSNLADYYLNRNEDARALDYARRGEALARQLDEQRTLGIALTNVGVAMARLGHVDAGIAKVRKAIAIAKRMHNGEHVTGMLQELITIYERAGRYREAVAALHEIAGYERALTEQQRKRDVLALQEQFSAERRTREIAQLSAENAREQALVRARTAQRWLLAALAGALALAAILLVLLLRRVRRVNRTLNEANQALAVQSAHDPLTGAFNRRHFETLMRRHEEIALAPPRQRTYKPFVSLVVLDLDHFKRINDRHGHEAGDAVLVAIAGRLRALVRQQDALVRWGGEEFVLVLPGTGADGMRVLLERALRVVGDTPVAYGEREIPVTVSAGGASFPMHEGQRWKEAMQVADLALYVAKATGRNRAVCVTAIAADADFSRLRTDLLAAQAAGDVTLDTITGPAPDGTRDRAPLAEAFG